MKNIIESIDEFVNLNKETNVFTESNTFNEIDLYDEKIQKALIKPPIFDFYYGTKEYGLDISDLVKNGFSRSDRRASSSQALTSGMTP